ncbi:hypothetical protein CXY01_15440 [Cellulomonas xylanilytica]|uniref:Endonuclease/exonuclease/phosphatase domain-containing protein n=1 Tax=Cellulomonas xylanilytica TaxID=233583 RepID=A0A510V2B0_9CELL|nr:hypothetical protein CXY01_15440 [Cellulomonas xylanilytica]
MLVVGSLTGLTAHSPAHAATLRTKVFEFNACDRYGRSPECDATAAQRAEAIATSVVSGGSNVVTLQEVCRYTYDRLLARLGPSWSGTFLQTTPVWDDRCAPGARSWGIALLVQAAPPTNVTATQLPKPFWEIERRYLLCGDVVLGAALRVCSSHFSVPASMSDDQAAAVGSRLATHAANGGAAILGADTNINVRSCTAAVALKPLYAGGFGGTSSTPCQVGTGVMVEADQPRAGGDGTYNAPTVGTRKLDYVFFTARRWAPDFGGVSTSSWVSDHNVLRGEGTLTW